jgi:hypothetical protein
MDDSLTRSTSDNLSEFIKYVERLERSSLSVAKLELRALFRSIGTEAAIKEAIKLTIRERSIPEIVSGALQGDRGSVDAFIDILDKIYAYTFLFNAVANLSDLIGWADSKGFEEGATDGTGTIGSASSLSRGFEELSRTFAGRRVRFMGERERKVAERAWLLTLRGTILYTLEIFALYPMLYRDLLAVTSCPPLHCYIALRELLRDSAVHRAIRSVLSSGPFDLETLYSFFIKNVPKIRRYVEEVVINDMKRRNTPCILVTTNVEPSVVTLSYLLYYHYWLKGNAILRISALDDSTDICEAEIDLLKDLGLETWIQFYELPEIKDEAKTVIEFVGRIMGGRKPKREAMSHSEYYRFRRVTPYAYIFRNIEKTIKSGDLEPVVKQLTGVGVAFLSRIFPFISVSPDGRTIFIRGMRRDMRWLLEAVVFGSSLSALYTVQLLCGMHAWKLLRRKRSRKVLKTVFERARAASYDPFLPPEVMARHPLLVYGSLLFKTVNALYETAGRSDSVFKPTGNFEEDVRRMWEILPPEYRKELEVEDEEQLLVLIERESYDLFMKVQRTPLEWYSLRFVKLLLEEDGP